MPPHVIIQGLTAMFSHSSRKVWDAWTQVVTAWAKLKNILHARRVCINERGYSLKYSNGRISPYVPPPPQAKLSGEKFPGGILCLLSHREMCTRIILFSIIHPLITHTGWGLVSPPPGPNIHPQDDSFLKKKQWDFENTPSNAQTLALFSSRSLNIMQLPPPDKLPPNVYFPFTPQVGRLGQFLGGIFPTPGIVALGIPPSIIIHHIKVGRVE